ncbi:hypothetical protein [Campylobacter showae]|uniref:hypothetical protein n=1 Tax=Campylobacter showae TaxID=204 RepID=UPI0028D90797|nr:hypothetical protein [Campylobacter showae]
MSGFYPFDVKPETFYEKGDFEVVYGFSGSMGGWRIGMRWKSSMEGKNGYPVTRNGDPCYFLLSNNLCKEFLGALLDGSPNDEKIKNAIEILKGENK